MIPPLSARVAKSLDPYEVLDYPLELAGKLLEPGEGIGAFTITPSAEATLSGLQVGAGVRAPVKTSSTALKIWFSVNAVMQASTDFEGAGKDVQLGLSITTDNNPARTRHMTLIVTIAQH